MLPNLRQAKTNNVQNNEYRLRHHCESRKTLLTFFYSCYCIV